MNMWGGACAPTHSERGPELVRFVLSREEWPLRVLLLVQRGPFTSQAFDVLAANISFQDWPADEPLPPLCPTPPAPLATFSQCWGHTMVCLSPLPQRIPKHCLVYLWNISYLCTSAGCYSLPSLSPSHSALAKGSHLWWAPRLLSL